MDGWKRQFKDCLQQSKILEIEQFGKLNAACYLNGTFIGDRQFFVVQLNNKQLTNLFTKAQSKSKLHTISKL